MLVALAALILAPQGDAIDPKTVTPLRDTDWLVPSVPTGKKTVTVPNDTAEINYTFSVRDTGQVVLCGTRNTCCINKCKGQKHLSHKSCDSSCDENCKEIHQLKVYPDVGQGLDIKSLGDALTKFGVPNKSVAIAVDMQAAAGFSAKKWWEDPKQMLEYKSGCFNKVVCGGTAVEPYGRKYEVVATWNLTRSTALPDGKTSVVKGPSGETLLFTVVMPDRFIKTKLGVACKCDLKVGEEQPGKVETGKQTGGLIIEEDKKQVYVADSSQDGIPVDFQIDDMNNGTMVCTNTSLPASTVFEALAGSVLTPITAHDCQDELLLTPAEVMITADGSVVLHGPAVAGQLGRVGSKKKDGHMRLACLDIDKKAPSASVKYKLVQNPDPRLVALCKASVNDPIDGLYDQPRIWIATSSATYDRIKARVGTVPPGVYLQGLYDVSRAGYDVDSDRFAGCFEAKHLGSAATPAATEWFVEEMERRDAAGLASWLSSNQAVLVKMMDSGTVQGVRHVAAICRGAGRSPNAALQAVAAKLVATVPTGAKTTFAREGGLNGVVVGASRGDASAIEALKAFGGPEAAFYLANLAKAG